MDYGRPTEVATEMDRLENEIKNLLADVATFRGRLEAQEKLNEMTQEILDPKDPPEFYGRSVQWVAQRRMDQIRALEIMVDEFKRLVKDHAASVSSPGPAAPSPEPTRIVMAFEDHEGERCAIIRHGGMCIRLKGIKTIEVEQA